MNKNELKEAVKVILDSLSVDEEAYKAKINEYDCLLNLVLMSWISDLYKNMLESQLGVSNLKIENNILSIVKNLSSNIKSIPSDKFNDIVSIKDNIKNNLKMIC